MRILFATLLVNFCLIASAASATSAALPEPVRAALKRANIPLSSIGVVVQQTNADAPLLSLNADRAMNPASTIKLLTTFSALEILGPAYQWKTEVYLDGKLENGVLQGNLVFKGYGDPKLTMEQFWLWLRDLRQRGLREIHGDIVLDRSYFAPPAHDAAEFDNDPTRAYNVGPNALLLNFNALRLRLIPNAAQTGVLLDPDLFGYQISNHITTAADRPCNGGDTYKAHLDERNIVLEGSIPADCGEAENYFSLLSHDEYFFSVFSALWQQLGGTLNGKLSTGNEKLSTGNEKLSTGSAPKNQTANQTAFSTHHSPLLSEVIRDINKFSNNIMARQLFLTLGTQEALETATLAPLTTAKTLDTETLDAPPLVAAPPASIARSTEAVQQWLNQQRLYFPELVLENGAGLSRKERISPQHLAELLQHAARSRYAAELEASLPILGMDGSVKKRFKGHEIAGYAHLKTGTLEGVKSLAGYVKARSGKQWIVVFVINHPNAAAGQDAQDALIEWVQTGH